MTQLNDMTDVEGRLTAEMGDIIEFGHMRQQQVMAELRGQHKSGEKTERKLGV